MCPKQQQLWQSRSGCGSCIAAAVSQQRMLSWTLLWLLRYCPGVLPGFSKLLFQLVHCCRWGGHSLRLRLAAWALWQLGHGGLRLAAIAIIWDTGKFRTSHTLFVLVRFQCFSTIVVPVLSQAQPQLVLLWRLWQQYPVCIGSRGWDLELLWSSGMSAEC